MRIVPLLTAAAVTSSLYLVVFEREYLISFATGGALSEDEEGRAAQAAVAATATHNPPATDSQTAERHVSVLAQRSSAQQVDSTILARGQTEAARQVDVRSETSGLIISDPLRRGAYVTAGQALCVLASGTKNAILNEVIARLDEAKSRVPEAEARLTEAKARLVEAEINDRAAKQLSQGGFASETRVAATTAAVESAHADVSSAQTGVQSARSGTRAAEANVQAAESDITKLTLTAPFNGLLETDTAELGSLLQPGASCATVIQLDPIKLVGFLPETEVDKVTVGAIAGARLASGAETSGRVTFLSRAADPLTRTFRVEVTVPNTDLSIRDGQTAELRIQSEGRKAHLLPASSLTLNDKGHLGVRVVDADKRAKFISVVMLRDTVDGVWLTGLPDDVDVIVVGQEFVIDGVPVDVTYKELKS
jgi:multidrug efflux system membrane fusion protein